MTDVGELLLDTGALVAILHAGDRDHARCAALLQRFRGTLLSTEAVLTECMYLLSRVHGGSEACLDFFVRGAATLVPQSRESLVRCRELLTRYRNVPMDFADATLVVLAEETGVREIFTLDRRGFSTYRVGRRQPFSIVPD